VNTYSGSFEITRDGYFNRYKDFYGSSKLLIISSNDADADAIFVSSHLSVGARKIKIIIN
jgi:hypothetical protein